MESVTGKKNSSGSSNLLAPGFRFHPTDEELVRYYLRRKVCGKGFRVDAISDIDIYKSEPWDLPAFSRLKSRDLEWYFFSVLDKKYGNGARTNRATEKGYWKTTGKDRAVYHRNQIIGMKKTLVYHNGRAPKGLRTNWVMHEYRLADLELERSGIHQDAFVLCRVFQKSGSGPKNGEQYGAPFVEEEWLDDELEFAPKVEAAEVVDFGDDAYLDGHDLDQILRSDVRSDDSTVPSNVHPADGSFAEETVESDNETSKLIPDAGDQYFDFEPEQHADNLYDLPAPCDTDIRAVKHEYIGESSKSASFDELDFLLDEPVMDSFNDLPYGNGGFIEANDLSNPVETNSSTFGMLEDYLYFDANDNSTQYDPYAMMGSVDDLISDQPLVPPEALDVETKPSVLPSGQLLDCNTTDAAASSSDKLDSSKFESDYKYPFIKQASHMLGSIPAPPAMAAEFPSKAASLSLYQPSSSVHMTAGMIQIRNLTRNNGEEQSLGKLGNLNIVLSFGFSQGDDGSASLESSIRILPSKTIAASFSRGWFYFMLFWVLVLSITYKIGACISAK
ncbi:hypothetical protein ACS0TY_000649 [Phlomoides rotata]